MHAAIKSALLRVVQSGQSMLRIGRLKAQVCLAHYTDLYCVRSRSNARLDFAKVGLSPKRTTL